MANMKINKKIKKVELEIINLETEFNKYCKRWESCGCSDVKEKIDKYKGIVEGLKFL